jgi:DNA-binding phage protein
MSHASRERRKAQLLNAAYRLLGRQIGMAEAARQLEAEFALSRRQAYRYLEQAAAMNPLIKTLAEGTAIATGCLHQILVRFSGASHILSPSFTPNVL